MIHYIRVNVEDLYVFWWKRSGCWEHNLSCSFKKPLKMDGYNNSSISGSFVYNSKKSTRYYP